MYGISLRLMADKGTAGISIHNKETLWCTNQSEDKKNMQTTMQQAVQIICNRKLEATYKQKMLPPALNQQNPKKNNGYIKDRTIIRDW